MAAVEAVLPGGASAATDAPIDGGTADCVVVGAGASDPAGAVVSTAIRAGASTSELLGAPSGLVMAELVAAACEAPSVPELAEAASAFLGALGTRAGSATTATAARPAAAPSRKLRPSEWSKKVDEKLAAFRALNKCALVKERRAQVVVVQYSAKRELQRALIELHK